MINFDPVNSDDILTALYRRLNANAEFKALHKSIDKGPKRPDGFKNPSATVHLLSAVRDGETDIVHATAVVNIYLDDTKSGRADTAELGKRAAKAQELLHRADLPWHPAGPIQHDNLIFCNMLATDAVIIKSQIEGEHVASSTINITVRRK